MKQLFFSVVLLFFSSSIIAVTPFASKTNAQKKVEIYYFHFTHRCATCKAVEAESKKALETFYRGQMQSRQVNFFSLNLDEKANKEIAKRCRADGQSLLLISEKKRVDLTDKAFMYARSNPEKLKLIIKTEVGKLLQ